MSKFSNMKIFKLTVFITMLFKTILNQGMNYEQTNLNNWSCSVGRRQSPISLKSSNSTYTQNFSLVYDNYQSLENVVVTLKNNVLEINTKTSLLTGNKNKGYIVFDHGGYYYKFNLEKIVIHVPSEHEIDGYKPDIEVMYYHRKDLDYNPTINQYKKLPDISEYLIISTLYAVNGTESDGGLLNNLRNYYYATGVTVNSFGMNLDIIPSGIIRDNKFYLYKGSDTLYPCDETHIRYVVADIYSVSQETVEFYKNAYASKYEGTTFAKSIAELNGRHVYRNFYANLTEANPSSIVKLSLFASFLIFFVFFF